MGTLRALAGVAGQRRDAALEPYGLDGGRLDVLETLEAAGTPRQLTAGELARACQVTPGAISQRLAGLERLGLVERHREPPDKRTVHVRLTDAGRERLVAVRDVVARAEQSLLEGLNAEQRARLTEQLTTWQRLVDTGRDHAAQQHRGASHGGPR